MSSKGTQQGFTLIELVFVIVILGILAAFAVPRFVDLTQDARLAALRGMAGAVRSASAVVHASSMAQQLDRQANSSVTAEGATVATVFGYPAGSAAGIVAALQSTDNFVIDTSTAGTVLFTVNNATTPAQCRITYIQPTAADREPTINVPATPDC